MPIFIIVRLPPNRFFFVSYFTFTPCQCIFFFLFENSLFIYSHTIVIWCRATQTIRYRTCVYKGIRKRNVHDSIVNIIVYYILNDPCLCLFTLNSGIVLCMGRYTDDSIIISSSFVPFFYSFSLYPGVTINTENIINRAFCVKLG